MNKDIKFESASYIIPQIPFVVAQIYCGLFVIIILCGPTFLFFSGFTSNISNINLMDLILSFPKWLKKIIELSIGKTFFILFLSFPLGSTFAELFY